VTSVLHDASACGRTLLDSSCPRRGGPAQNHNRRPRLDCVRVSGDSALCAPSVRAGEGARRPVSSFGWRALALVRNPLVYASARAALRVTLLGGVHAWSDAAAFERLQRRAAQTRAGHVLRLRPAQPSDRVRVFLPCAGGGGSFGAPAAASNLFGAKPAGSPFGTAQARARPLSVHRALFQRAPSPRAV